MSMIQPMLEFQGSEVKAKILNNSIIGCYRH